MNVSFQFSPSEMLSQLTSGIGPYTTSFSGSISVVPEPTITGCFLSGLVCLGLFPTLYQKSTFLIQRNIQNVTTSI